MAVLCVVVSHVARPYTNDLGLLTALELGRVGVLLFFVHTALVLMASLERQGTGAGWVRTFYIRRAARIYPLAIAVILVVCGSLAVVEYLPDAIRALGRPTPFTPLGTADLFANLTLVQNLVSAPLPMGPLWSLPIEVQMYVTLPLCYLIARRSAFGVGACLIGAAVLWWLTQRVTIPGVWRLSLINYVPCFLSGVLAYALLRADVRRLPAWTWLVCLAAVLWLAGVVHPAWDSPPRDWVICLVVGMTLPLVNELEETWFTRGARVVCTYSYGIYLTHIAALWIALDVCSGAPVWARGVIFIGLAVAFSVISYHVVERPGMAFGAWAGQALQAPNALLGWIRHLLTPRQYDPRFCTECGGWLRGVDITARYTKCVRCYEEWEEGLW